MERKYWIYFSAMIRQNGLLILAWLASGLLMAGLLWLYQQDIEPAILYLLITFCILVIWCAFYLGRLHKVSHLLRQEDFDSSRYPLALRACAKKLEEQSERMKEASTQEKHLRTEMQDYFSLWAHQIKLPLASLKLQLELPDPNPDALKTQAQRIDDCVSLAMAYVRLGGSDFQIGWFYLEDIIKPILRSSSTQFIHRHISLHTDFENKRICSDRKWTTFIVEQLLSNALKYAPDGSSIILRSYDGKLVIQDEGPGIRSEELPRVFEKGFTGTNGRARMDASSGLGLFLVKGICDQLSIQIELANRFIPLQIENAESPSSHQEDKNIKDEDPSAPSLQKTCGLDVILHFPDPTLLGD